MQQPIWLYNEDDAFPPVDNALAQPNGLLALGGSLSPQRLHNAYKQGIFPWFSENEPILWWSPDPRAVLFPDEPHVSRSFKKFMKRCSWNITINHQFEQVIDECSQHRSDGTWITDPIKKAYCQLHQLGLAHSIEVWDNDCLIGGLYGIELGGVFCGESMFSRQSQASKCALIVLCQHFSDYGGKLIDCQVLNPHTESLGALNIPRKNYIQLLTNYQKIVVDSMCWQPQTLPFLAKKS